jgi:hypothetical protein
MNSKASHKDLLDFILGYKEDMWGYDTEDYKYWEEYLTELPKCDLIEELIDHKLTEEI